MRLNLVTSLMAAAAVALLSLPPALAKKEDFTDQDLRNKDFQNKTLDGSNFTRARLNGANFNKTRARNTVWEDAEVTSAYASHADFTGADFRKVVMTFIGGDTNYTNANFQDVDMKQISCYRCVFDGANLRGTENWGDLTYSSFRKADLRGADFHTMTLLKQNELEGFTGAYYDDETIWPDWVDMKTLPATKIGTDDPLP